MKDRLGNELKIGDWVVVTIIGDRTTFGRICDANSEFVYLSHSNYSPSAGWFGSSVEKISDEEAMIHALENYDE